jgi:hypothetical protein
VSGFFARRRRVILPVLGLIALVMAAQVEAQFRQRQRGGGGGFGRGFGNVRMSTEADYAGGFQFCRIVFGSDFRGDNQGGNWSVDWPRADINLSTRLSELTKTYVPRSPDGDPAHLLIRLTDAVLFQCPFIMMTEVGSASLSDEEAARLHEYLDKGGFLWADDFWGEFAWQWWEGQLRRALPADKYPLIDLPPDHPLFRTQFDVKKTPQISSINYWAGSGGDTSERGADSAIVHTRAIIDSHGRIMALMTHNTDFGDGFEREAENPDYFLKFSVPGYQFGVNALIYAMTH